MGFIADVLLLSAALLASFYCWMLGKRLKRLNNMDEGVGAAITALNRQVDEMKSTLQAISETAGNQVDTLRQLTFEANKAAARLELTLAALHDDELGAPRGPAHPRKAAMDRLQHIEKGQRSARAWARTRRLSATEV